MDGVAREVTEGESRILGQDEQDFSGGKYLTRRTEGGHLARHQQNPGWKPRAPLGDFLTRRTEGGHLARHQQNTGWKPALR